MLADQAAELAAEDLECLATAAYLTGRDHDFHKALERAHHAFVERQERARAARAGFWLGLTLMLRGEMGQATGWLSRARRLVEGEECVEHGYLQLPLAEQQLARGEGDAAFATASAAAALGERFADADLIACARHLQGRIVMRQGRVEAGLALLDEAMLAVVADELSPIVTGLVYCSVIAACSQVAAMGRAREWTAALGKWCAQQPDMVAFTNPCLVHRAEVLQLSGAWPDAMREACRACERFSRGEEEKPPAAALYRQGEIHRLRGEFAQAEAAYRDAARLGCEPQPGLALLRMAQGRHEAACAALRRVLDTVSDPLRRACLLPAQVEILLAANELEAARGACAELEALARKFATEALQAMAGAARGALELAAGEARAALGPLRRAFDLWRELEAPYEAARVRTLLATACRALGDEEAAALELEEARRTFERLGAAAPRAAPPATLTVRELEVLRLVAAGKTNKRIARELRLSERTIDRHVSNILTKLDVPSRAAATAWAYERKLL